MKPSGPEPFFVGSFFWFLVQSLYSLLVCSDFLFLHDPLLADCIVSRNLWDFGPLCLYFKRCKDKRMLRAAFGLGKSLCTDLPLYAVFFATKQTKERPDWNLQVSLTHVRRSCAHLFKILQACFMSELLNPCIESISGIWNAENKRGRIFEVIW